ELSEGEQLMVGEAIDTLEAMVAGVVELRVPQPVPALIAVLDRVGEGVEAPQRAPEPEKAAAPAAPEYVPEPEPKTPEPAAADPPQPRARAPRAGRCGGPRRRGRARRSRPGGHARAAPAAPRRRPRP